MVRTNARELACQLVFEMNFTSRPAAEILKDFFEEDYYKTLQPEDALYEEPPDPKQSAYIANTVLGVEAHKDEFTEKIRALSIGWSFERIAKMAVAIMEVAMFDCLYADDVPPSAAVNEAVELTRKYEDEDVVAFVNGILGSFLRQGEAQ